MVLRFAWLIAVTFVSMSLVAAAAAFRDVSPALSDATLRAARVAGPMTKDVRVGSYEVSLVVTPNRARTIGTFSVRLLRHGRRVRGARVKLTTMMGPREMPMGYTGRLPQRAPGYYAHAWPGLMPGTWRLHYTVAPPRDRPFGFTVVDRVA